MYCECKDIKDFNYLNPWHQPSKCSQCIMYGYEENIV